MTIDLFFASFWKISGLLSRKSTHGDRSSLNLMIIVDNLSIIVDNCR